MFSTPNLAVLLRPARLARHAITRSRAIIWGASVKTHALERPSVTDDTTPIDLEKIVSLCKRRGFIFQNSEVYGGLASTYDYGAARRRAQAQREGRLVAQVRLGPGRHGRPGLGNHHAPGRLARQRPPGQFHRPARGLPRLPQALARGPARGAELPRLRRPSDRLTQLQPDVPHLHGAGRGRGVDRLPQARNGPRAYSSTSTTWLNTTRRKLPFGVAQIGKAFRNEITTGNFIFRTREFEIMEIEYFVKPGEDDESHRQWVEECLDWYRELGVSPERAASPGTRGQRAGPLLQGDARHRVPVPLGLGRDTGNRQPNGLRFVRPRFGKRGSRCPGSTTRPASGWCHTLSSRPPASTAP